jgi:hypothetical protein
MKERFDPTGSCPYPQASSFLSLSTGSLLIVLRVSVFYASVLRFSSEDCAYGVLHWQLRPLA